ncbi:uncharacterized protein Fot_03787 [Forsythia ovata]|uniref:Uncharacterized protein n=1 Tax=Forsythia ovata TaxID=205694 RepID=A0ABD1XAQ0_9LAMI
MAPDGSRGGDGVGGYGMSSSEHFDSDKDAKLSRYLGSLARTYNFLSLSHTDWRSYKDPIVEKIWKTISRLAKRVRNNRAELKRRYYTPNVGSPLRFMSGDDRVDSEQWREMEQKHGHTPDPIEAFNLVHKRKDKHKSWIDDAFEQMGAKISQELTGLVATHGDETPELRLQAYVTATGFETGGRVCGYGDVVTPDMVSWIT